MQHCFEITVNPCCKYSLFLALEGQHIYSIVQNLYLHLDLNLKWEPDHYAPENTGKHWEKIQMPALSVCSVKLALTMP